MTIRHSRHSRITAFVLAVCIALLSSVAVSAREDSVAAGRSITEADALKVSGEKIVDMAGNEVVLRGTNFGGWGIMEDWFCPIESPSGERIVYDRLCERFGQDSADELLRIFRRNWITEVDFKNVAELGMNVVRLPIWYRNFQSDDNGTWFRDGNGDIDFSELDWIADQCRDNGLYLILDLHGLPGYQNDYDHSGKSKSMSLFDDTQQGRRNREIAVDFWTELATHFSGDPVIAMYDLMNEQLGSSITSVDSLRPAMWDFTDELYKAIRAVDPDHIITMECIWSIDCMPDPADYGWENVVYQLHFYDVWNGAYKINLNKCFRAGYGVPLYIGESYPRGISTFDYMLSLYNNYDVSWTSWTYKGVGPGADTSTWFLYGCSDIPKIDYENDSYDVIAEKWGESLRTDSGNFTRTYFASYISNFTDGHVDRLSLATFGLLSHTGTYEDNKNMFQNKTGAMITTVKDWIRKLIAGELL